jgi:hypothetical protein
MKVMTARVVDGKITVEADLQEGTPVAILAADETGFHLTAEEEDELNTALTAIRGGSYVDGRELIEDLRRTSGGR